MFLINILQQTEWGEWDVRRDKVMLPTQKLKQGNGGDIEKSRRMMGEKRDILCFTATAVYQRLCQ